MPRKCKDGRLRRSTKGRRGRKCRTERCDTYVTKRGYCAKKRRSSSRKRSRGRGRGRGKSKSKTKSKTKSKSKSIMVAPRDPQPYSMSMPMNDLPDEVYTMGSRGFILTGSSRIPKAPPVGGGKVPRAPPVGKVPRAPPVGGGKVFRAPPSDVPTAPPVGGGAVPREPPTTAEEAADQMVDACRAAMCKLGITDKSAQRKFFLREHPDRNPATRMGDPAFDRERFNQYQMVNDCASKGKFCSEK